MDQPAKPLPETSELPPPHAPSSLSAGEVRVGQIAGVEIRLDWSLLVIVALITYNLGAMVFPVWHPGWSAAAVWGLALLAAVLVILSILAHELSHALVARTQGLEIRRISLFVFGGVAHLEDQPPTPKAEFLMAIVGPITSIVIGVLAMSLGWALGGEAMRYVATDPVATMGMVGPGATLLLWLGPVNLILGVFNLVPGFPLDGGRVLRSLLWWGTGDLIRATRWSSIAGQVVAWFMMGWGVLDLFGGAILQGVWLLLLGWFLASAARSSFQQLLVRRSLKDIPAVRIMSTRVEMVGPTLSVEELVHEHLLGGEQRAFPVVDDAGTLMGLVTLDDVRRLPNERWPSTPVTAVMIPLPRIATLGPQAGAEAALEELARRDIDQIPVVDQGHVLGMVRRRDLLRWIALQGTAPPPPSEPGPPIA